MPTTNSIIEKAAIGTTAVNNANGLLNPEKSSKFLRAVMDTTPLLQAVRHETRTAKSGYINKIGVGKRMLREKIEGTDAAATQSPNFSDVQYNTTAVRLDWDINGELLRQNIEQAQLENTITAMMTGAIGVDEEDLALNGDTATSSGDTDYDFLKLNDGWIKLLDSGTHIVDRSSVNSGAMSIEVFFSAIKALPSRYHSSKLRWVMSPNRAATWQEYLLNKAITAGGIVTDNSVLNPGNVPVIAATNMPDDKIILTDPKNLILVNTYDVIIKSDRISKDAIRQDKVFYVVHFDMDPIIEELNAAVLIKGLASIS